MGFCHVTPKAGFKRVMVLASLKCMNSMCALPPLAKKLFLIKDLNKNYIQIVMWIVQ